MTTTVREKGQITIPAEVRRAAHLEEGDPIEVEIVAEGILLRPQKVIDATQAWFWTPAWQESVRRSIEQIEAGEGVVFGDDESFRAALDSQLRRWVPTYLASPEFLESHARLSPEQKKLFRAAVDKFIEDLKRGQRFRKGLRVKGIKGAPGLFEMTWAPDGRAIFSYGAPRLPGETHIDWHAVGTHNILPQRLRPPDVSYDLAGGQEKSSHRRGETESAKTQAAGSRMVPRPSYD